MSETSSSSSKPTRCGLVAHPWRTPDTLFAVGVFLLLVLFFLPSMLPGKTLYGSDSFSQAQVFWFFGEDFLREYGRLPYWNPYINSGMPYFASLSGSISAYDYLTLPLALFVELPHASYLVMHLAFGAVMAYIYLGYLGLNRWSCALGGLLFGFNHYMISRIFPGHGGKICVLVFLPLALYCLRRAIKERKVEFFAYYGLLIGIQYMQRHPQILFYCLLAYTAYFFFLTLPVGRRSGQWELFGRYLAVGAVTGALGFGVAAYELWPHYEYKQYTLRGEAGNQSSEQKWAFNTSYSLPPEEVINIIIRNPFGWEYDRGEESKVFHDLYYAGRMNERQAYEYVGIMAFLLAIFAVVYDWKRPETKFYSIAFVAVIFLAMGRYTPVFALARIVFPPFSFFRVPLMIYSIGGFFMCVLPALGLDRFIQKSEEQNAFENLRPFFLSTAAVWGTLLFIVGGMRLSSGGIAQVLSRNAFVVNEMTRGAAHEVPMRLDHFLDQSLLALLLAGVGVGLLLALAMVKVQKQRYAVVGAILAFATIDLWTIGDDFIIAKDKEAQAEFFAPDRATPFLINDDTERYRIFSIMVERYPNEYMVAGIESTGGYHAIPLWRYQLITSYLRRPQFLFLSPYLDMLNVKYMLLHPQYLAAFEEAQAQLAGRPEEDLIDDFTLRFDARIEDSPHQYTVWENTDMMPRAWLVDRVEMIEAPDYQQLVQQIANPTFDPREFAYIEEPLPSDIQLVDRQGSPGTAAETLYEPERIGFTVDADRPSLMVMSEIYFPGWYATVNGQSAPVIQVNGMLRAVPVPAGRSDVVLEFKPVSHIYGMYLSIISGIVLLGMAIVIPSYNRVILPEPGPSAYEIEEEKRRRAKERRERERRGEPTSKKQQPKKKRPTKHKRKGDDQ